MIDSILASLNIPTEGFADDLKFVIHLKRYSKEDTQTGIELVHSWSVQMIMPLSIDKCLVIYGGLNNPKHQLYQCRSAILPEADKVTDLRIMRSADNAFHDHIAATATKGLWKNCVGEQCKAATHLLCCSSVRHSSF